MYAPPPNGFRTFLIVWATQSVSTIGTALTAFAVNVWLIQVLYAGPEQKADLAYALVAFNLAYAVPVLVFGPLAGAWADRHDRKRTMLVCDVLSGAISLLLAALMAAGMLQLWMLVVAGAVASLASAFHDSAFDTSYAMLVHDHELPRANGLMQTSFAVSSIFGPVLAALIIALPTFARQGNLPEAAAGWLAPLRDGTALALGVDALTFVLAAIALLPLHVPSPQRAAAQQDGARLPTIWADIREGALYIQQRRPLLWLLSTFAIANMTGAPLFLLLPLLVKYGMADWPALGLTFETALAGINTLLGIGGVAGGLLISSWGGLKRRRVYGVLLPMMVDGIAQIVLGITPFYLLGAAVAFAAGIMNPLMNAHSQAIWQAQTPRELQGRVFSVRRLIAQFTGPLSVAVGGWAAGIFSPGLIVAAFGAILLIFCIGQLFNRQLLRVEDKAWLDRMAAAG
jgi:MFS transporter, DHA3 family, macrolide efflux protein